FQAEDGIRDLIVTGVQTCALPICFHKDPLLDALRSRDARRAAEGAKRQPSEPTPWGRRRAARTPGGRGGFRDPGPAAASPGDRRSEERRVGKECRGRGGGQDVEEE